MSAIAGGQPLVVTSTVEVDHATAAQFRAELTEAVADHLLATRLAGADPGARPLVIDLDRVEFMDSTGVSILLGVDAALRAEDAHLQLIGVQPAVRRALEVTGVWDHLHERPTGG